VHILALQPSCHPTSPKDARAYGHMVLEDEYGTSCGAFLQATFATTRSTKGQRHIQSPTHTMPLAEQRQHPAVAGAAFPTPSQQAATRLLQDSTSCLGTPTSPAVNLAKKEPPYWRGYEPGLVHHFPVTPCNCVTDTRIRLVDVIKKAVTRSPT
jgi:hypothetical protein